MPISRELSTRLATALASPNAGAELEAILNNALDGPRIFQGGVSVNTHDLTLTDINVILSSNVGTQWGTSPMQKQGFYGVPPVRRPAAYTQTYSNVARVQPAPTALALTAAVGVADGTIDDVGAAFAQGLLNNNFQECAAAINKLIADVAAVKQIINAVVDDLQLLGLVG